MTAPTEANILSPIPVSGDKTPPNVKKLKPRIAEAFPALLRSISIAKAVEVGKIKPKNTSVIPKPNSVRKRLGLHCKSTHSPNPQIKSPITPMHNANRSFLNIGVILAPNVILKAAPAKQSEYQKPLSPKCA